MSFAVETLYFNKMDLKCMSVCDLTTFTLGVNLIFTLGNVLERKYTVSYNDPER